MDNIPCEDALSDAFDAGIITENQLNVLMLAKHNMKLADIGAALGRSPRWVGSILSTGIAKIPLINEYTHETEDLVDDLDRPNNVSFNTKLEDAYWMEHDPAYDDLDDRW